MKKLVSHFVFNILPRVNREIRYWEHQAKQTLAFPLQEQALLSLRKKRFHAQGGCVYALRCPQWEPVLVPLIVAVQTISDYLDNLCDRMCITDPKAFRTLHQAFMDALTLGAPLKDYYQDYPHREDRGYLTGLVTYAQARLNQLPAYGQVQPLIHELGQRYSDLQVYKHIHPNVRASVLRTWADTHPAAHPQLQWWEFSAATGSTLAIFALLRAATQPRLSQDQGGQIFNAYFPWICALHILLDYLIDLQEDEVGQDLNFVAYYPDCTTTQERLNWFIRESLLKAQSLDEADFHATVVKALPALYLSDCKVQAQNLTVMASHLLNEAGTDSRKLFRLSRVLRFLKQI